MKLSFSESVISLALGFFIASRVCDSGSVSRTLTRVESRAPLLLLLLLDFFFLPP